MAPTTLPPFFSGMPPAKIITLPPFDAWMPKKCWPDCELSPLSLVVISPARAVQALLIEMFTDPIHAPSMRTWATRLPPSSATAMFMGWPISFAFFSAAAITRRAASSVTSLAIMFCLSPSGTGKILRGLSSLKGRLSLPLRCALVFSRSAALALRKCQVDGAVFHARTDAIGQPIGYIHLHRCPPRLLQIWCPIQRIAQFVVDVDPGSISRLLRKRATQVAQHLLQYRTAERVVEIDDKRAAGEVIIRRIF